MNNNDRIPYRIQAELLGIICIFQQKIQSLKQELAGFSEFDVRTAFCQIDFHLKGYIDNNDLRSLINRLSAEYQGLSSATSDQLSLFLRRYGSQNRMTYQQFLLLILPKNSPSLAQSLMVRNPSNSRLPEYLRQRFESLIGYYIIMILETEERKQILYKHFRLNILQQHHKLHRTIDNQQKLYNFINSNEYQVNKDVIKYLINHTSSRVSLKDFHQNQYREIFSPIDSITKASVAIEPLSLGLRNNFSPEAQRRLETSRSPSGKKTFVDSFYEKSRDNYLNVKFNTIRSGMNSNRIHYYNENIEFNVLPAVRQLGSAQSIRTNEKQRLNYSPIVKDSVKHFQSIDFPGMAENFTSQKNLSQGNSNPIIPLIPTRQTNKNLDHYNQGNQTIPHPPTNTFLIDKFLKHQTSSPARNYKPHKQIFEDDLEESLNNAFKYY